MTAFPKPVTLVATTTTNFSVQNGQFIDPSGAVFVAKGINCYDGLMATASTNSAAQPLTTLFPGINFIRLNTSATNWWTTSAVYPALSTYDTFVSQCTAHKIVVMIEDHPFQGSGPSQIPLTGAALKIETDFYAGLADRFKNNPYVWFATNNEPASATYDPTDIGAISAQQLAIYNAIRGNSSNIVICEAGVGGGNSGTVGSSSGFVVADYSNMTNVGWDIHCYYSNGDLNGATSLLHGVLSAPSSGANGGTGIIAAQTIQSKDGVMPVIVGEWGAADGATGNTSMSSLSQAITNSGCGYAAWGFYPAGVDNTGWDLVNQGYSANPTLTTYGQLVATMI